MFFRVDAEFNTFEYQQDYPSCFASVGITKEQFEYTLSHASKLHFAEDSKKNSIFSTGKRVNSNAEKDLRKFALLQTETIYGPSGVTLQWKQETIIANSNINVCYLLFFSTVLPEVQQSHQLKPYNFTLEQAYYQSLMHFSIDKNNFYLQMLLQKVHHLDLKIEALQAKPAQ